MGRVRLEMGVEVLRAVLGVDELVEALAGVVVALVGEVDLFVARSRPPGRWIR